MQEHEAELDISMVPFRMMVYAENRAQYIPVEEASDSDKVLNISGTGKPLKITGDPFAVAQGCHDDPWIRAADTGGP